jgi:peptidoglycan/LPS O-acetylase OafA/YrhL
MSTIDHPAERLHALDAVRGGALLLGVAFHATLSFLPGPQIWVVRDVQSAELGTFFFVAHIFRMTLFFLIAGFFARMLLERRGVGGFARNRAVRILAPLLVFWPIAFAGIIATFVWGAAVMNGGTLPTDGPPPPPLTIATFPLTHLWFLYVLLWLYAGALVLRGLAMLADRSGRLRERLVDPAMRLLTATPLGALALAVPVAAALILHPVWFPWGGVPTPDAGLLPNTAALVSFGAAFGFGWLLERQRGLLGAIQRWWPVQLVLAALLTVACLAQLGTAAPFTPIEGSAKTLMAVSYALAIWTWTLGLLGLALRLLSKERPAVRYLSDASYWIYLLHLPVVMALQVMVFSLALPAVAKWAIVTGGAFLILIASYHLLVRHSWIGKWLNGRKYPWRKPPAEVEMQTV